MAQHACLTIATLLYGRLYSPARSCRPWKGVRFAMLLIGATPQFGVMCVCLVGTLSCHATTSRSDAELMSALAYF